MEIVQQYTILLLGKCLAMLRKIYIELLEGKGSLPNKNKKKAAQ
jgi:hypothetical protein